MCADPAHIEPIKTLLMHIDKTLVCLDILSSLVMRVIVLSFEVLPKCAVVPNLPCVSLINACSGGSGDYSYFQHS